jgi:hypothetical protein
MRRCPAATPGVEAQSPLATRKGGHSTTTSGIGAIDPELPARAAMRTQGAVPTASNGANATEDPEPVREYGAPTQPVKHWTS